MSASKTVILTALREELHAVAAGLPKGAPGFDVIRGGIGPDSAARAAAALFTNPEAPKLVCSTGFCGGIADGLAVGDLVVATAIVEGDAQRRERIDVAPELLKRVTDALKSAGIGFHSGVLVSVRDPVLQTSAKRALGRANAALAVDMESYAIADAVRAQPGTAFLAMRVVSDAVGDELPPEVAEFLDAEGKVRTTVVARFVLRSPANMKKLWELKGRSDKASKTLTAAWKAVCGAIR
jgi:nucleoside phosphorylase